LVKKERVKARKIAKELGGGGVENQPGLDEIGETLPAAPKDFDAWVSIGTTSQKTT
jgi:hypothetical protein